MNAEKHGEEWVRDSLEQLKNLSPIQSATAYRLYVSWCKENGLRKNTHSVFGGQMTSIGVRKRKSSNVLYEFGDIVPPSKTERHTVLINREDQPHVEVWHHGKAKATWTSRRLGIEDGMNAAGEFMLGASNE
jgi:hypothetical protein